VVNWIGLFGSAILSVGAGVSFVVQQAVNANLRASLNSAAWAGFVSYLGGTVCMVILALVMRDAVPSIIDLQRSNWWAWTGGFFGAIYIAVSILLVPRIGAAMFIALLVAGQMIGSLVFDQFGAFGLPQHSIDLPRMLGAALLVAGAVLVRA
jgi:transporter family-2 protein